MDNETQLYHILNEKFGLSEFRPGQKDVIDHILKGGNGLCVMPTGGGKSLCYQLPSQILSGLTMVVSPLISLMKDQVDSLKAIGIDAAFINSSQPLEEQREVMSQVAAGSVQLLYVAPERFRNSWFMEKISALDISLLAIDEAHCISEWGHDFRPDYLRLGMAAKQTGAKRILACTATATPMVRDSIIDSLNVGECKVFVYGFNRPNLSFVVLPAPNQAAKTAVLSSLLDTIEGAAIVYTATRKNAEAATKKLLNRGEKVVLYHAGLDDSAREEAQNLFMNGEARIAVATNAFGMGVDRSDIRLVVHWDFPRTLEALYQEAGRAGRDGLPATCAVLFSYADKHLQEFFIRNSIPEEDTVLAVLEALREIADPNGVVLRTYSEIARHIAIDVNDMAVSASVITLEKAGFLKRLGTSGRNGWARAKRDLHDLRHQVRARQKARIAILDELNRMDPQGGSFNIDEVARDSNLSREALRRELMIMSREDIIDYEPPFRGRGIELIPQSELLPDFSSLNTRRKYEMDKLRCVLNYCSTLSCRRAMLMQYFGEHHPARCDGCDRCVPALRYRKRGNKPLIRRFDFQGIKSAANSSVTRAVTRSADVGRSDNNPEHLIVNAVKLTGGRLGIGKIVDILKGSRKKEILALRPERWIVYGAMSEHEANHIKNVISEMLDQGRLKKTPGLYPLLKLP